MKYVSEEFVNEEEMMSAEGQGYVIKVRFCRDCPLFEYDSVQRELPRRHGICNRLSRDIMFTGVWPHYVHTYEDSFCNEDNIRNEDND